MRISPHQPRSWAIAIWIAVMIAAGWQIWSSMRIDADISAFMPRARTVEQAYLLDELNAGEAARLWLLAVTVTDGESLSGQVQRLVRKLEETDHFSLVYFGQPNIDDALRKLLFRYRYLLDPAGGTDPFTTEALRSSLQQGLTRLRSPASPFEKRLVVRDPTDSMRRLLTTIEPAELQIRRHNGIWTDPDGQSAFLMLATKYPGTDLEGQEAVAADIHKSFDAVFASHADTLRVSGPPAFAIATKARIQSEAKRLAIVSTSVLLGFLLLAYRNWRIVLLISVPLGTGLLVATALTSAIWGSVHGISFAFGITLLGVALDYPVHLFGQVQVGETNSSAMQRIWPTMRLGLITTVLGFAAMLTANFPGIEQLAVFSITGLIVAALVTRYVLVEFERQVSGQPAAISSLGLALQLTSQKFWWLLPCVVLAALVLVVQQPEKLFATDIQELSPIPRELMERDIEVRRQMGLLEPGELLLLSGPDAQEVLRSQEELLPWLQQAYEEGFIGGFDMASIFLPSRALQSNRQASLPTAAALRSRLDDARTGLPFKNEALQSFVADVGASKSLPLLDASSYSGTAFETRLNSLLRSDETGSTGIVRLLDLQDRKELTARLKSSHSPDVVLLNVRDATNTLVNDYRNTVLLRSAGALLAVIIVLMLLLRDGTRVFRVIMTVVGAAMVAASTPVLLGQSLNIFHLISLLLVIGIGLDYALFFSRELVSTDEFFATRDAVAMCAVSTFLVFGIMAFSQLPVLRSIGLTVTAGTIASFVFSIMVNRKKAYAAAKD